MQQSRGRDLCDICGASEPRGSACLVAPCRCAKRFEDGGLAHPRCIKRFIRKRDSPEGATCPRCGHKIAVPTQFVFSCRRCTSRRSVQAVCELASLVLAALSTVVVVAVIAYRSHYSRDGDGADRPSMVLLVGAIICTLVLAGLTMRKVAFRVIIANSRTVRSAGSNGSAGSSSESSSSAAEDDGEYYFNDEDLLTAEAGGGRAGQSALPAALLAAKHE